MLGKGLKIMIVFLRSGDLSIVMLKKPVNPFKDWRVWVIASVAVGIGFIYPPALGILIVFSLFIAPLKGTFMGSKERIGSGGDKIEK